MKKLIYLVSFLILGLSCYGQLDTINTGNGYNNGSGDNLNTICKKVNKNDKYLNTQLGLKASSTHTHGNITNVGAIGATSGLPIITTTSGVLTTGAFGTTSGTFAQGNDSRLSDSRTPTAHNQAESTITFTNITTGNATTSNHGYLPQLGGGTTNFLRADGTWAAPSGGGTYTATAPIVVTSTVISVDTTKAKNKIATYSDVQAVKNTLNDTISLGSVAFLLNDTIYHAGRTRLATGNGLVQGLAGKQNSLTLTTTGTSGAATLTGATLNIPQYSGGSMTWPSGGAGIPNYNGSSAWGTSYTTSGSGTVLALATGAALTTPQVILATPGSSLTANGTLITVTAGENLVFGDVVYIKSDGKYWKARADASTTVPVVGMSLGSISANASGNILQSGLVRNDSWSWSTVGGQIWLSVSTAGAITQTKPSATGNQLIYVGYAKSATEVNFNPSPIVIEISAP